jgi:hypothetical protein
LPDGYAAGFRRAINLDTGKLSGVKSHDYHIFMERLLPVMFRGYLDDDVWTLLAELSHFYRQLCAKEIKKDMMEKLEDEISVLLYKLEKIFPPGWFNPMPENSCHELTTTWEHYRFTPDGSYGTTQGAVAHDFWVSIFFHIFSSLLVVY